MCKFAIVLTCLIGLGMDLVAQPVIGSVAPNFTLNLVNGGGPITLANFAGEVVYLNFFGATCSDCIEDGPLSEEVYDMFVTDSNFNIFGLDVWNLPAPYVNTTFRANAGITYPLLGSARTTGYAYNMETVSVPSMTDNEHRGHVIIDQQGIIRYYAIYNPLGTPQQTEIIDMIEMLLDPCGSISELDPPGEAIIVIPESGPVKVCWNYVPCATRYLIFRSILGDWSDEEMLGTTTEYIFALEDTMAESASFRIVAEHTVR